MSPSPLGPVPDWATRLGALKLALAYEVGLPIARVEKPEVRKVTTGELESRLLRSPGTRHAFRAYIDSIDRKAAELESSGAPEKDADQPEHPTEMEE